MGLRETYSKFFTLSPGEVQENTEAIDWAYSTQAMWREVAFTKLIATIEAKANKPLSVSQDAVGIASEIGQTNAYRDIVKLIHSELARAGRVLSSTQGGTREG